MVVWGPVSNAAHVFSFQWANELMHNREVEGVGKGVDGRKLRIYPKITHIRAKCDITRETPYLSR